MKGLPFLRYLRLYGCFLRFSVSRTLEFRIDFYFRFFMDLAYYAVNIAFYKVVFLHTDLLGGWNQDQTMIFLSGFLVVDAIAMTVFSNNIWQLPGLINRGDMDYYLLRPVSSLFFLSLRDFAANSFLNLVFALGILGWAVERAAQPWSAGAAAVYLVCLGFGAILHYIVHMLIVLPVFWMQSGASLHVIFYSFQRFMERPDRIYTGWVRKLLLTAAPFCLMTSFPARIFLEGVTPGIVLHFLIVLAAFFGLLIWVWDRGLRAYSSASS